MLEPYGAGIRYPVAAPGRVTVMDVAVAMVPNPHRYLATRNQAAARDDEAAADPARAAVEPDDLAAVAAYPGRHDAGVRFLPC